MEKLDKEKIKNERKRYIQPLIFIFAFSLFDSLIIEMFNHKTFTEGPGGLFEFIFQSPLTFLVAWFMVLATLSPILFSKRLVFWGTLVSIVWLILGGVNGFIILNRMTPFTTADLEVLNAGLDILPNYLSTGYIILLIVAAIAALVGLFFLFKKGKKSTFNVVERIAQAVVAFGISALLLVASWNSAFAAHQLSTEFPNLAIAYDKYGFEFCFLETWLKKGIDEPINYSEEAAAALKERIETSVPNTISQTDVNVIFVQLESFIDPSELTSLKLNKNCVPNWTKLKENYTSGYLRVPVVGAGTANTECEVLTGINTKLFGPGEYPYKTCLTDQTIESVAYDLKENGYATHAIHNHRGAFYGRNVVYKNLGFDDFTALEYMKDTKKTPKNWCKDYILTPEIIQTLASTENQADLVFTVSVQGHGTYPEEQILEDPEMEVLACGNEEKHYAIEYYVNQIHEMDEFIGNLVDRLEARDEKTILVLYGDHLPSLDFTKEEMKSGTIYQTEYIIWDNFGLKQKDEDLCAYQLFPKVLSKIGITTGLMNQFHQFCNTGVDYKDNLNFLQYDALYGEDYIWGNCYEPSDMKMGIGNIKVSSIIPAKGGYYILGTNFTSFCKATLNGEVLNTKYMNSHKLYTKADIGDADPNDIYISVVDKHKEILSVIE